MQVEVNNILYPFDSTKCIVERVAGGKKNVLNIVYHDDDEVEQTLHLPTDQILKRVSHTKEFDQHICKDMMHDIYTYMFEQSMQNIHVIVGPDFTGVFSAYSINLKNKKITIYGNNDQDHTIDMHYKSTGNIAMMHVREFIRCDDPTYLEWMKADFTLSRDSSAYVNKMNALMKNLTERPNTLTSFGAIKGKRVYF